MDAILTQDVSNEGNRGRPPMAREVVYRHEVVWAEDGETELGELVLEPQANGTALLTVTSGGAEQKITLGKARRPKKASSSRSRKA